MILRRTLPALVTGVLTTASAAVAQQTTVSPAPKVSAWPTITAAVVLTAVILIASFKGAKRSHLD